MSFHFSVSAARRARMNAPRPPQQERARSGAVSPTEWRPTDCGASSRSTSRPLRRSGPSTSSPIGCCGRCRSSRCWSPLEAGAKSGGADPASERSAAAVDSNPDWGELATLRLCGDQRAYPRGEPRLLSQSAGERAAWPVHPQGAVSWLQWSAIAIAAVGIVVLAAGALDQLWISLTLCVSFATYGLLRKIALGRRARRAGD